MPIIKTVNIISQLVTRFGLQYAKVLVQGQNPTGPKGQYSGKIDDTNFQKSDNPLKYGQLGTPVFTNIIFKGGSYINHINGYTYTFDDVEFQTVLLSVSQAKKIIKTEIQGRDGTVKEYIGMDDYQITVDAIINGTNGHYPDEVVVPLKKMLDAPVTVDVECQYLLNLGIHAVVVESYEIGQEAGMYSQQRVTINCISDVPIVLQGANF